jgi:hypothetical protein
MKAMLELENAPGEARKAALVPAEKAISEFQRHLESSVQIRTLDDHSKTAFGVALTLRAEIGKGLGALEKALQQLVVV